jgi:cysteinyl-tRNA synthetase
LLKFFNSLGKRMEPFRPVDEKAITMFTCGPSIYQRAHIGNFRTFLFEDILVRYLEYLGYTVKRGMNITDIEDKAIKEAEKRRVTVKELAQKNIEEFLGEINLLRMKVPDYLPKASENVESAVDIIERLLDGEIAYWHEGNIYFDPLKFPGFGELYGLDMAKWPAKKRRFHRDTYPGMQWNRGDFILWHGCGKGDPVCWDTRIGKGRPSWNIQDPSMIGKHFTETLSIYCGGFDNLFRHHDYTRAILESIRPYPMARYWLHCHHLHVNGQKMSKSKGNIYYTDTLIEQGYDIGEIRFFLIYGHYRETLNYSDRNMRLAADKLRTLREIVNAVKGRADRKVDIDGGLAGKMRGIFSERMDDDLDVKGAFDGVHGVLSELEPTASKPAEAAAIIAGLREIDEVLRVIFQ